MPPPQFILAVFGRFDDFQAKLSAYDLTDSSRALADENNAELAGVRI